MGIQSVINAGYQIQHLKTTCRYSAKLLNDVLKMIENQEFDESNKSLITLELEAIITQLSSDGLEK